jgi:hypothetical protein
MERKKGKRGEFGGGNLLRGDCYGGWMASSGWMVCGRVVDMFYAKV